VEAWMLQNHAALEEEDEEARLFILEFLFGLRLSFRLFARANRLEKFMS
jgi:hypothetical protein